MSKDEMRKGIHEGAASGDAALVAKILAKDKSMAEYSAGDKFRDPIHGAATPEVARLLVEHGADVGALDSDLNTPLHLAKSAAMVDFFVENGADVLAANVKLETPVQTAADAGVLKALVRHGARLEATPEAVYAAVRGKKAQLLELLLSEGGDANARRGGRRGDTLLHTAVMAGNADVAKVLLAHGADPNAKAAYDATPLHHAALNGSHAVARVLLEAGADANAVLSRGAAIQRINFNRVGPTPRGLDQSDAGGATPSKIAKNAAMKKLLAEFGGQ